MTSVAATIAGLVPDGAGWRGVVPANWTQGRTTYGGLSTALALHAAQRVESDLPPLRTAQIAFVAPLAGMIEVRSSILRRGRNSAFVQADVSSDAGLGLRATFVFLRETESVIRHEAATPLPGFPCPSPGDRLFDGPGPDFIGNFEFVDRRDASVGPAEWVRWMRLKERDGLDPYIELITIGDCLPPAALKLLGTPAPLSTMTWQMNLLTRVPETDNGWWLLRAVTDAARGGSSSQNMAIWNARGEQVAAGTQSVVIFA